MVEERSEEEALPPFPVVGVGASAGGLEAFRELLQHLPARPGVAVVFVMHLDPSHDSLLPSILSRATAMPVVEARDGMPIERDHVYTIPASGLVAVRAGRFDVTPRSAVRAPNMPIDHLFRSIASACRERGIGVVLSGGGTDGTLGLIEIQAEGGVTFSQDDGSARAHEMPRSAIASGQVDRVLPPSRIARELFEVVTREANPVEVHSDDTALHSLLAAMRASFGVDFSQYKMTTILRRIRRRMALTTTDSLSDYAKRLEEDSIELQSLYQDFLIRVTSFFRDPAVFDVLEHSVFPALIERRDKDAPIRVWVAGCATGEEVYSIAITLLEALHRAGTDRQIKVLATDVSDVALERARAGIYLESIEQDVPAERLRRYFQKRDGHYQVSKTVRDCCVFARHNLTRDPPFSKIDLVSCRNVLIYFNLGLQKRVVPIFHYALNPRGFLVLGTSETIGSFGDLFDLTHEKHKIYEKKSANLHVHLDYDLSFLGRNPPTPPEVERTLLTPNEIQREADRLVLRSYGPAGVVVDESWNILQFRGQTGAFLEPSPGIASLNLQRMAREGLLVELQRLLERCRVEQAPTRREGLILRDGDAFRAVNLQVVPLRVPPSQTRCYLVLFEDAPLPVVAPPPVASADTVRQLDDQRTHQLQQELDATREYLQSIIEQYEATNEELKSAHEEILSSNEELQSTNEELQTAKEEMQSANEELSTVNDELRHRNLELAKLNDDLTNLFSGVNIPIVMVGRDLRIRRMTPLAEQVFNLRPIDVGRPISDIRPNLEIDAMEAGIEEVVRTLTVSEIEVPDRAGRWYSLRIQPYVTQDGKIDGASIVAFDVDPQHRRREVDAIVDAVPFAMALVDGASRVGWANGAFRELAGTRSEDVVGSSLFGVAGGRLDRPEVRAGLEEVLAQGGTPRAIALPWGAGSDARLLMRRLSVAGAAEPEQVLVLVDVLA